MKRVVIALGIFAALISVGAWGASHVIFPARAPGQYFDSNGVKIFYTEQGQGEPVILIHGFGVHQDLNWRKPGILDRLARHYHVVALDNRGHGLSEKPHDPAQYGAELAEDVVRLMDHLKIAKAHVVGYSMGAFITVKLIATHPDRLLSAMPCGAGWQQPGSTETQLFENLANDLDAGRGFDRLFAYLRPKGRPENALRTLVVNAIMSEYNDKKALAAVIRSFRGLQVEESVLRKNTVPVMSVVGSIDPLRTGVDNLSHMPNMQAVYVKGGDHMNTMDSPLLIGSIEKFLAEHSQAQPPAATRKAA